MSETPRTSAASFAAKDAIGVEHQVVRLSDAQVLERELNGFVKVLLGEHPPLPREGAGNVVLAMADLLRLKAAEAWIADLEEIGRHTGNHNRQWHGEIGWLYKGQVAYVGEVKPSLSRSGENSGSNGLNTTETTNKEKQ